MAFDTLVSVDSGENLIAIEPAQALANAGTTFTQALSWFRIDKNKANRYIGIHITTAGGLTSGNLKIYLAGTNEDGSAAPTTSNAPELLELRASAAASSALNLFYRVDLNAYPARVYYIAFTTTGDGTNRTPRIAVFG